MRQPLLCSDAGHVGPPILGTVDFPEGTDPATARQAAWGYVCAPCADRLATRRAVWAAAHPGQMIPPWADQNLNNP